MKKLGFKTNPNNKLVNNINNYIMSLISAIDTIELVLLW